MKLEARSQARGVKEEGETITRRLVSAREVNGLVCKHFLGPTFGWKEEKPPPPKTARDIHSTRTSDETAFGGATRQAALGSLTHPQAHSSLTQLSVATGQGHPRARGGSGTSHSPQVCFRGTAVPEHASNASPGPRNWVLARPVSKHFVFNQQQSLALLI